MGIRTRWLSALQPGDLVEMDATPITLYPGCQRVHMTARARCQAEYR